MAAAATDRDQPMTMGQVEKMLWELAENMKKGSTTRGGSGVSPNQMFGSSPWDQHTTDQWPVDKLKAIGGAYSSPAAVDLFCRKRNGQMKVSGIGPAMVKLFAMHNADARAIATSQNLWSPTYGEEQLEKEYGFVNVQKAASHGIRGLNGEVRKTALAEGSGQTGGYVIPPQFMNELLTIAAEDGFIEQRAKVVPMNSRSVQWPMLDITTAPATGTSPYFGGILATWQPEAASITETEPQFRQSEWVAWDLVLYSLASNQLLADNGIAIDALLTQLFGQAMTWYKEFAYLQGKGAGTSMPLGILNAPATYSQSRVSATSFQLADAAAMMSHLQIRSWDDACWVMHYSVIPQLIQMSDYGGATNTSIVGHQSAGMHLSWITPFGDGKVGGAAMKLPTAFLNGLPIYFTEKVPQLGTKGDVMLIDWSRYVIGMRLDLQIDVSPHFRFQNNQLAWRVISRCDGKPWLNNTITDAEGWSLSPFVVLN